MPFLPLPARFRRPVLLIVGCGDIGLRVARSIGNGWAVLGLTSSLGRVSELRAAGVRPVVGDLDRPETLARLGGLADAVLHLAPPPGEGDTDRRTRVLLQALARRAAPRRIVYVSTSGVYGDCDGARIDETRALAPATARARRRVDAETCLRLHARARGIALTILRVPGIYASDRPGGHPRERLLRGTPVLTGADDVYTNHIHADDLARACIVALHRGPNLRAIHVSDDTELRMGDYFDLAAELCGLPRPPRIDRVDAARQMSAMQLSFMGESRRLDNRRLKGELRLALRYPTVAEGLRQG
ncbi:MAG: NAD-dependent epimerase/dehydratase family protein [Burkholderiaceae bacterium]